MEKNTYANFSLAQKLVDVDLLLQLNDIILDDLSS